MAIRKRNLTRSEKPMIETAAPSSQQMNGQNFQNPAFNHSLQSTSEYSQALQTTYAPSANQNVKQNSDLFFWSAITGFAQIASAFVNEDGNADGGTGTGFVIYREEGENGRTVILTNRHVAPPVKSLSLRVQTKGGEIVEAKLAGYPKDGTDLAVLLIKNLDDLKPMWRLAHSDSLDAGDQVFTIGHPLGTFDFTVSEGNFAQIRNNLRTPDGQVIHHGPIIQHSVAISPGNSGGPLFGPDGSIVGVNTYFIDSGNALYFAIPVDFLLKEDAWLWEGDLKVLPLIRKIQFLETPRKPQKEE